MLSLLDFGQVGTEQNLSTEAGQETTINNFEQTFVLNNQTPDAHQIIAQLDNFTEAYSTNAVVRSFAESLIGGLPNNAQNEYFNALACLVVNRMKYTADPPGVEYVISPVRHILQIQAKGETHGDCDDHVLLLNCLCRSIGIPVKAAAVKVNGSPIFNHVISQVLLDNVWKDFDPCRKSEPWTDYPGDRVSM